MSLEQPFFSLTGKTALITGASGGIGRAIADTLNRQGAHVILTGRNATALASCADSLANKNYTLIPIDLTKERDAPKALATRALEERETIDILVNNAGMTRDQLLLRLKDSDWHDVVETNLTALFRLCRAVVPLMMKKRWGRIISISSIVGRMGNAGQTAYSATKAGMEGFSRSLAKEVARRHITVNCIAPGFITTPMTDALDDRLKQDMRAHIPIGRFGQPHDVATAVAFLASEQASYITGETLHVNGGMMMA
ncbi:MAG: 3-oxoacyl-[acyl-carrier-protein] reductase [Alphaproteobacteria bacterium GM7ARS4]|nr:3-oxoacyl-[acyl-carrier-protein] reductase [Alphaproteobacteria bacterium GM7ARS4]